MSGYKYDPPAGYTPSRTRSDIEAEFKRWQSQADDWQVVSDYDLPMQRPGIKAAEVVFLLRGNKVPIKVDKWDDFGTNLRCCYLIIRDMRLGEARGMSDAMREAYLALPAPTRERDPYEVLGVRSDTAIEDIEAIYRSKAKRLHPDAGGSDEAMKELNAAFERIKTDRTAVR